MSTAIKTQGNEADLMAHISELHTEFENYLDGKVETSIHKFRVQALKKFQELGFPNLKHEEWRYTNIKHLLDGKYDFKFWNKTSAVAPAEISKFGFEGLDCNLMVFVNGIYSPYVSRILTPVHEMEILSFGTAESKRVEAFYEHFGKYATIGDNGFTALNTAFAENGTFIYVPTDSKVALPTVLLYITDATSAQIVSQPRNLVVMGPNSKANIICTYVNIGSHESFCNSVTEVVMGENADLEWIKFHQENELATHIGGTFVNQASHSALHHFNITLDGKVVRNNLHCALDGEYITCNMNGLYVSHGSNLVDNHTVVAHNQPNSESHELYKGIVADRSTAVFNGKILVDRIAQKTNAFQSNKNILLSNDAEIDTKPQLEIFADDVKCSHGATVGGMDEEAIFYMRTRGIGEQEANKLLLQAFGNEVIERISLEPVKEQLLRLLQIKLAEIAANQLLETPTV